MKCKTVRGVAIRIMLAACVMLGLGGLAGCGSGGGGGEVAQTPGVYSGATTQATVTESNAVALSADAYAIGATGSALNMVAVAGEPATTESSSSTLSEVALVMKRSAATAIKARLAEAPTLAGYSASNLMYGAYGGSASYTININESTNSFTGSMTFTNLRDTYNGPVISGTVGVAGVYNPQTGDFTSLTIAFSPLSATTSSGTTSLYGTISYSFNYGGEVLRISCTVAVNGVIHWVNDWTFTYSSTGTVTLTGKYYHPAYGYVAISTVTPMRISSATGQPISGVLQFTGSNGTKAKVTFTSSGYSVSADSRGNGQWVQVR